MVVRFIDRTLKPSESSHYYCDECGVYLTVDSAYSHKCSELSKSRRRWWGV